MGLTPREAQQLFEMDAIREENHRRIQSSYFASGTRLAFHDRKGSKLSQFQRGLRPLEYEGTPDKKEPEKEKEKSSDIGREFSALGMDK